MFIISKKKQNSLEELKSEQKNWKDIPDSYDKTPIFNTKDIIEAVETGKIFILPGRAYGKAYYFVLASLLVVFVVIANISFDLQYSLFLTIGFLTVAVIGYIRFILDVTNNKKGFIVMGPYGIYYKTSNKAPVSKEWKSIDQIGMSIDSENIEDVKEHNKIFLKSKEGWEVIFKWEHYKHPQILNFSLLLQLFRTYRNRYSLK